MSRVRLALPSKLECMPSILSYFSYVIDSIAHLRFWRIFGRFPLLIHVPDDRHVFLECLHSRAEFLIARTRHGAADEGRNRLLVCVAHPGSVQCSRQLGQGVKAATSAPLHPICERMDALERLSL